MQIAKCVTDDMGSDSDRDRKRVMRGRLRILALMVLLLEGCGGGGADANPATTGFINQTQHTDAELWALRKAAQQDLSLKIDLNPLQRTLSNVPARSLPGDSRVWNMQPQQLEVAAQQDVSSAAPLAATGMSRADPRD